uniref:MauE/DoxX family redox-associated membrane protein n=1 Tax=Achromobacter sp. GbtcB20 TaxID=2824765 RepID=UPI001C2F47A4
ELLAAALVLSPASRAGMLLSLVLMCAFSAVLGYQFLARGIVRCSCFGQSVRPLSGYDVLRNLLVAGTMLGWLALAPAG